MNKYKLPDDARCISCNKKLKQIGKRCTSCSIYHSTLKRRYPTKSEEELAEMTIAWVKGPKRTTTGGRKPKYIKGE